MNAIEIHNLVKKYDKFTLDNIDLEIPSGMIVGLIGENGAGKTTLIKALLNIIKSDSGKIQIFEKDMLTSEKEIKEEIGVVLDNMFFPEILSATDIDGIMKSAYKNWDSEMYYKYLKDFDIPAKQQIKKLSKGMRKKLEIATALSHHPKLLILDEPTSGLDPVVRSEVLDIFLDFIQDEDHTILLSTHITSDLEHIADHIVFIDGGKKVVDKSRDDILENYGVLKCSKEELEKIDKEDIISYRKNRYDCEILVSDITKMNKKYKDYVIDKITLEELMVLMIKGEK